VELLFLYACKTRFSVVCVQYTLYEVFRNGGRIVRSGRLVVGIVGITAYAFAVCSKTPQFKSLYSTIFRGFSQNCEKRLLASSCPFVRPSVCLLSAHETTPLPLDGF
jgi:hypothetical protein